MEKVAFRVLWGVSWSTASAASTQKILERGGGNPGQQAERTLDLVPSNPASQRQNSALFSRKGVLVKSESAKETVEIPGFSAVVSRQVLDRVDLFGDQAGSGPSFHGRLRRGLRRGC